MKAILCSLAAALLAITAITTNAQTTTTTTVTASGTLHQFTPGSVFVVNEAAGPVTYRYGDSVTYVTADGTVIPATDLATRIKVGSPVTVHYSTVGDARVVNRVVLAGPAVDDDDDDDDK